MARPSVDTETPSPELPRRPGRPPKPSLNRDIDKAADEMRAKHTLPDVPGKQLKWEQMQDYFTLLTPEMWSHVACYLYRIKPRIIRQLKDPDAPKYIDVIAEPFTMEYMIQRHGGGKYMLEVVNPDRTRRESNSTHLFRCYFEIDEVRHEPKLNYEELDINNRDNMSYVQLLQHRGILDSNGRVMNQQANQQNNTAAGGVNADVIKEILGFVSKLNADQQTALRSRLASDEDGISKSLGNVILEKIKQDDPAKQVSMLASLLATMKEVVGGKPADNTAPLYDRLIQMQSDHNTIVLQLFKEISASHRPAAEGSNLLDNVDKFLDVAEKLSGLRGGGGGGGHRNGWELGLDYARELVVPGLQTLNNFFALRNGQPVAPVARPGAPGAPAAPPAAFDPYANPAATRAYAQSINTQRGPGAAPVAPPSPAEELAAAFQQYGPLVLNALNNSTPGYEFADYVVALMGAGVHAMFASQGEDALVTTAMSIPQLAMFGEQRLRTFANEFIHYQRYLDETGAEPAIAEVQ